MLCVSAVAAAGLPGVVEAASPPAVMTAVECRQMAALVVGAPVVRRRAAAGCVKYAVKQKERLDLWKCSVLRRGPRAGWWRVRNACKLYVSWPLGGNVVKRQAVRVGWCEGSLDPRSANGQYLGTLQMGTDERATYGHGPTIEEQAAAAAKYYDVSGWTPWQCHPGSSDETRKWREAPSAVKAYG